MNKKQDIAHIGKFNLTNIGECEIIVKSHENKIKPRFYIIDSNGKEICAICMFKTEYIYGKKLDEIQRKELQEFLDSDSMFKGDIIEEYLSIKYTMYSCWEGINDSTVDHEYKDIEKLDFNNLPDC